MAYIQMYIPGCIFSPPRGAVSASEGTIKFGSVCLSVRLSTFSCVHDSATSFCQIDFIFGIHVLLFFLLSYILCIWTHPHLPKSIVYLIIVYIAGDCSLLRETLACSILFFNKLIQLWRHNVYHPSLNILFD